MVLGKKYIKQNKLLADSHKTNNLLFPSKHLLCSARDKMEVLGDFIQYSSVLQKQGGGREGERGGDLFFLNE